MLLNLFKKTKTSKCCKDTVSEALMLEKWKKEATECMVFIRETLQPTLVECHRIADDVKAKGVRKEIAEKIEKALIPFYNKLEVTVDNMMKFSFKYDLGYLKPNLKEYYDAEVAGAKGYIKPARMYQSLDYLHQMYSRVNLPGALKTDMAVKLRKSYIETKIINQILAALITSIGTEQRELSSKAKK